MCMCFECVQKQQLGRDPIIEITNSEEFSDWAFQQCQLNGHMIVAIPGTVHGVLMNTGFINTTTGEEFEFQFHVS